MSVAEAQSKISAREFSEWLVYAQIEPFGYERMEIALAIAASGLANCWGAKTKPKDFMPDYQPKQRKTEEQMIQMLDMLARQTKAVS